MDKIIELITGDITTLDADAIVNAANNSFWAVVEWMEQFIMLPDLNCWLNAEILTDVKPVRQK